MEASLSTVTTKGDRSMDVGMIDVFMSAFESKRSRKHTDIF